MRSFKELETKAQSKRAKDSVSFINAIGQVASFEIVSSGKETNGPQGDAVRIKLLHPVTGPNGETLPPGTEIRVTLQHPKNPNQNNIAKIAGKVKRIGDVVLFERLNLSSGVAGYVTIVGRSADIKAGNTMIVSGPMSFFTLPAKKGSDATNRNFVVLPDLGAARSVASEAELLSAIDSALKREGILGNPGIVLRAAIVPETKQDEKRIAEGDSDVRIAFSTIAFPQKRDDGTWEIPSADEFLEKVKALANNNKNLSIILNSIGNPGVVVEVIPTSVPPISQYTDQKNKERNYDPTTSYRLPDNGSGVGDVGYVDSVSVFIRPDEGGAGRAICKTIVTSHSYGNVPTAMADLMTASLSQVPGHRKGIEEIGRKNAEILTAKRKVKRDTAKSHAFASSESHEDNSPALVGDDVEDDDTDPVMRL